MHDHKTCQLCDHKITPKRPAAGVICKPCDQEIEAEADRIMAQDTKPKRKRSA